MRGLERVTSSVMKYIAIFDQIVCLLNQITKRPESNEYRVAYYLNRIS